MRVVIVDSPGNSQRCPGLSDMPLGTEKPCSLEGLVLAQEILVLYPELSVVAELVIELLYPVRCPFLGAVA